MLRTCGLVIAVALLMTACGGGGDAMPAPHDLHYALGTGQVGSPYGPYPPTVSGTVTGYSVSPALPAGLTLVSATTSQGPYTAGTGVWNVGVLAAGVTATMQMVVTVNGTAPVVNTATRTSSTPADPVSSNDSASSTVTGSTVPGLPNNGVFPIAQTLPSLVVFLLVVLGLFAGPPAWARIRRR